MIEQFFTQPKVLSRLQEGVFGRYLAAFAACNWNGPRVCDRLAVI